ncbi:Prefoldin subunit 3 [Kluyveromyces marxianus]
MDTLFSSTKTNPRGIPEAPFVEKVEQYVKNPEDFDMCFSKFQEHLSKYKYMQESKLATIKQLKGKIPDIENTLNMCQLLKEKREAVPDEDEDEDEDEGLLINYQLNDTLFSKASVDPKDPNLKVGLWLGADVMLEYPLDEAIELLNQKLADAKQNLDVSQQDVEFLRENITTMEVNCARLYNWDVQRRQMQKKEGAGSTA